MANPIGDTILGVYRLAGLAVRPLDINRSGEWFEVEDQGRGLRVGRGGNG